jgi:GGDEF domain-containing protein
MQDIKKHLQRIQVFLKVFRDSKNGKGKEWLLDAIEEEIKELAVLLDSGEVTSEPKEEVVQLSDILRDVVKTLKSDTKKRGIFFELDIEDNLPPVKTEVVALKKALLHILSRAIPDMVAGETLILCGKVEGEGVKIEIKEREGKTIYSITLPKFQRGKKLILEVLEKEHKSGIQKGIIFVKSSGVDEIIELYGEKHFSKLLRKVGEQVRKIIREGDRYLSDGEGRFLLILNGIDEELILEKVRKRIQGVLERIGEEEQFLSFYISSTFLSPDKPLGETIKELKIN